ncbi:hypothetical protein L6259_01250 [Candidatus Parcubacteria bacterium]|nr:hypothetical protein [Patescibacteria group bacterium]MCG2693892.1 hypothetical protein [Candidatus Parcubacteria bacterium]
MSKYTDKDVEIFRNTNCPLHLLGENNDFLKKHMEAISWKWPKDKTPIVIESKNTERSIAENTTAPGRPPRTIWNFSDPLETEIQCANCGYKMILYSAEMPDSCPNCKIRTRAKNLMP